MPTNIRKIIHVDMDAFYASVEQRDFPELRGKPIAVGGRGGRGVVAAASYEARKFGVHSAMPSRTALRLCPELQFVPHRFDVYKAVSRQIMDIFRSYTDLVEPLSLDEAFLDVTTNKQGMPSATIIAQELRSKIKAETGLTASAGVSINKFLAKIASDVNKPDGLTVIPPEHAETFIDQLPVNKFFGVGKVTAEKMNRLQIFTGSDLKQRTLPEMVKLFGKAGRFYHGIARGQDERPVVADRIRKSIGSEQTFENDLSTEEDLLQKLLEIAAITYERLQKSKASGRTITVKIKHFDFTQQTRSRTLPHFLESHEELEGVVTQLLHQPALPEKPIRLLGVTLSNLNTGPRNPSTDQLTLDL